MHRQDDAARRSKLLGNTLGHLEPVHGRQRDVEQDQIGAGRGDELDGVRAVVGFADDTNILGFDADPAANCRRLGGAWDTCAAWAATRGMEFAPQKSELMHLTRATVACTATVRLGNTTISPTEEARFLGVWLDRKLK